jgi:hypothetical protein
MSDDTAGPWDQFTPTAQKPWEKFGGIDKSKLGDAASGIIKGAGKALEPALPDLPFHDRVVLASLDTQSEKKTFLEKMYGKGSVSQDKKGLIVTKDGKRMRASEGFWASLASDAPETVLGMAGAAEGAATGSAVGPVGTVIGGVVGAAAGAMAGKSIKEASKSIAGLQGQNPAQIARSVGLAGESGMESEVTARGVGGVVGRITRGPLPRFITGTTKETEDMTERLVNRGARPHPQSTMPTAKHIQRVAILADKISGPSKSIDRANIGYLQDHVESILNKARVPKAVHDDVIKRLSGAGDSALSFQEVGRTIQNTAKFMASQTKGKDAAYFRQLLQAAKTPEDAYTWLTAPGQGDRLDRFIKVMGQNSAVVAQVRYQALRNILSGAMVRSATGEATEALDHEMGQFTSKQQRLLFPHGLDDDIKILSKEIKFLYPKIQDTAMAGFKAGNILSKIFFRRWTAQAFYSIYRGFLQRPGTIRRLAVGFKGDSTQRKAARNALRGMLYFGALEMNQGANQAQSQPQPAPGGPQQ